MGLAYLFARSADTIADTGSVNQEVRLDCLGKLKAQFGQEGIHQPDISSIQSLIVPQQSNPSERILIEELGHCFSLYQQLNRQDQSLIANLLATLIEGMEFDQARFPKQFDGEVHRPPFHE